MTRTAKIVPNCSNVTDERNKKHAVVKGLTLYGQDWKRYKGMNERRKTPRLVFMSPSIVQYESMPLEMFGP